VTARMVRLLKQQSTEDRVFRREQQYRFPHAADSVEKRAWRPGLKKKGLSAEKRG
jgi:hypothetical protein